MLNEAVDNSDIYKELTSLEPAFNGIKIIITRILVILELSVGVERHFLVMRRIKTYLRSKMTIEPLHNNNTIISIERQLSSPLINYLSIVIN